MVSDLEFHERIAPLRSAQMGTEVMAPLLHSLVRFTRPKRVLEIGSGYTSLFILRALAQNMEDEGRERDALARDSQAPPGYPLAYPPYYARAESSVPVLHTIDSLTHPATTARSVTDVAAQLGLADHLRFHHSDFRGYAGSFDADDTPFDLVWMDAGAWHLYLAFFEEYWPLIDPAGGLWVVHSTQTNLAGAAFVTKLKLLQATEGFNDLEILSLVEPHKFTQNSTTLIRRISDYEENILTERA